MMKFNTGLYGYDKKEVEEYINDLRDEHQEQLARKRTELTNLSNSVRAAREENAAISSQIETESRQKENYLQHMNLELQKIESALASKQIETEHIKSKALNKLELKKNELEKNQDYVKKMQRELKIIKNKNRLLDQLYSN